MRLLEHQAKKILSSWGIPIPRGVVLSRPNQLTAAFSKKAGPFPLILKAQVYAGGRGKAGGIVKVGNLKKAKSAAADLLGKRLVTPQTGPEGVPVKCMSARVSDSRRGSPATGARSLTPVQELS